MPNIYRDMEYCTRPIGLYYNDSWAKTSEIVSHCHVRYANIRKGELSKMLFILDIKGLDSFCKDELDTMLEGNELSGEWSLTSDAKY